MHSMRKAISRILIFTIAIFLLNGCAAVLNFKRQPVTLHTGNPDAKIFINDKQIGEGAEVKTKLRRDGRTKQIRIEAPGYKPSYYSAILLPNQP